MTVDLATPIFFAEFSDGDGVEYAPVRMCIKRHRDNYAIDHFNKSYTYISNGAHIDMVQDGIIRIHYVETFDRLRSINPQHHALPENVMLTKSNDIQDFMENKENK